MKLRSSVAAVLALALLAACATTKVTDQTPMVDPGLARPNNIYVYDFVADPSQIPQDSAISANLTVPSTPPTPEELETGRKLGALIAHDLAADIRDMGLSAMQAGPGSVPQVGDGVIRGYLVSAEGGSTVKRFVIGFGSGASEMDALVEGFAVTREGWRKLGSGSLNSSGNKMPGLVVPAAVAVATGSPIGLIVMGGVKVYGEASGKNTLEGRAKATADKIAEQLKVRFKERGWIS
jgi:hypothetical protein